MSKTETPEQAADRIEGKAQPLPADAVAPFESYLAAIPDAEGGGYESILAQIDSATDLTGLDAPWRTGNLEQYKDQQLVVRGMRKVPSDFGGGLPYFLVVDAIHKASGQAVTLTTGAVGIVAQLVKAYALGALPCTVVPKESERTTRSGYTVWHLEFVA